jgi:branched-chain amino acid transport system permease protein
MVTTSALGSGIVNGVALALVSLGFTLVFRATKVVNFANGVQMVLGGYVAWQLSTADGLPAWMGIVAAVAAGALSGLLVDRIALRPLRRASLVAQVIVLLAVTQVELMVISLLLVVLLTVVLRYTSLGLRMRMVASNQQGAVVSGVDPSRMSTLAWCVGGALAALSGALIFPTFLLSPDLGQQYTFNSFAAVVLGGFGSLPGAVVGGVLIGVVQSLVASAVGATYGAFVALGVMVIVLLARPSGLLGARA